MPRNSRLPASTFNTAVFDCLIHGFINLTGAVTAAAEALDEIALMLKGRLECPS